MAKKQRQKAPNSKAGRKAGKPSAKRYKALHMKEMAIAQHPLHHRRTPKVFGLMLPTGQVLTHFRPITSRAA